MTPDPALRTRLADAMRPHFMVDQADAADDDLQVCACGQWRETHPITAADRERDWDSHIADVVLAVLSTPAA